MSGQFRIRVKIRDHVSGNFKAVAKGLNEEVFQLLEEIADETFRVSRERYLSGDPIWSRTNELADSFRRRRSKTGVIMENVAPYATQLETGQTPSGDTRIYAKDKPLFVPLVPEAYRPHRLSRGLQYGEDYILAKSVKVTKKPFFWPAAMDVMSDKFESLADGRLRRFIGRAGF